MRVHLFPVFTSVSNMNWYFVSGAELLFCFYSCSETWTTLTTSGSVPKPYNAFDSETGFERIIVLTCLPSPHLEKKRGVTWKHSETTTAFLCLRVAVSSEGKKGLAQALRFAPLDGEKYLDNKKSTYPEPICTMALWNGVLMRWCWSYLPRHHCSKIIVPTGRLDFFVQLNLEDFIK